MRDMNRSAVVHLHLGLSLRFFQNAVGKTGRFNSRILDTGALGMSRHGSKKFQNQNEKNIAQPLTNLHSIPDLQPRGIMTSPIQYRKP
jgi:hypothetical protein